MFFIHPGLAPGATICRRFAALFGCASRYLNSGNRIASEVHVTLPQLMNIVILGLSITSSAANGHAATYRNLVTELERRGHDALFLERNLPSHAQRRDMPGSRFGRVALYESLAELEHAHAKDVANAHCVIVGAEVPEHAQVNEWVKCTTKGVVANYNLEHSVLSIGNGPGLTLYSGVDPLQYYPKTEVFRWDLANLESYSPERRQVYEKLMFGAAREWADGRFAVVGQHHLQQMAWPLNVAMLNPLRWNGRRDFYNSQYFMLHTSESPSVYLFEAAACATPIISAYSSEIEALFKHGREIFFAETADDVVCIVRDTKYLKRAEIGWAARRRILAGHTIALMAQELERLIADARAGLLPDKAAVPSKAA